MPAWPHAPAHRLSAAGAYMVTASTCKRLPHFRSAIRLSFLCEGLLDLADANGWNLQAWAIFPNHYHFIAILPQGAAALPKLLGRFHAQTARWVNEHDATPARQVWFQFWDTHLTFHRSYLARLQYVHTNPVHHRVIREPSNYPWCSAAWFRRASPPSFYKTVNSFPVNRLNLKTPDDFLVDPATIL